MLLSLCLFSVAVWLPPGGAKEPEACGPGKEDAEELQGSWKLASLKFMGSEILKDGKHDGKGLTLTIKGNNVIDSVDSVCESGPLRIDAKKRPKTIDFINEKYTIRGIYDVRDKQLKVCFLAVIGERAQFPDVPRPEDFSDDQVLVVVLYFERK